MAKTKISEYSATSADNTDISNINIAEGCSPANVNNAIRTVMAQLKDQQDGTSGDPFTCSGTLTSSGTIDVTGGFKLDGSAGTSGQVIVSAGTGTPTWGNAFVAGMIMMWSGSIATIPTGWYLCNGSNSTPDLRNRFVIGAFSDNTGVANTTITGSSTQTGGSKDAITVDHTHTINDPSHVHNLGNYIPTFNTDTDRGSSSSTFSIDNYYSPNTNAATTGITINNAGSSGTNANLVPYYALAFIMKA
jgi:microcystin-dependent protein